MKTIDEIRQKYFNDYVYLENLIRAIYPSRNGRFVSLNSLINNLFRDHGKLLNELELTRMLFMQHRMLRNTLAHENGLETINEEEYEMFSMINDFNQKILKLLTRLNIQIPLKSPISNMSVYMCNNCKQ